MGKNLDDIKAIAELFIQSRNGNVILIGDYGGSILDIAEDMMALGYDLAGNIQIEIRSGGSHFAYATFKK